MATCRICLLDFNTESIKKRTKCQHEFCEVCLDKWLEKENTCPICRTIISDKIIIKMDAETRMRIISFFTLIGHFDHGLSLNPADAVNT